MRENLMCSLLRRQGWVLEKPLYCNQSEYHENDVIFQNTCIDFITVTCIIIHKHSSDLKIRIHRHFVHVHGLCWSRRGWRGKGYNERTCRVCAKGSGVGKNLRIGVKFIYFFSKKFLVYIFFFNTNL